MAKYSYEEKKAAIDLVLVDGLSQCEFSRMSYKKLLTYENTPTVAEVVKCKFHTDKSNKLCLADITEFAIPAGKIYLSALVDCFDGLLPASPLLQFKDAYSKMVIARTRHDEYQYEEIKVVDIADWLLDK